MDGARDHRISVEGGASLRLLHWAGRDGPPVLLLPGRTECIEKYVEVIDQLRRRGRPVWALDWRGQGLSSRTPGCEARGHVEDFDLLARDLEAVLLHVGDRPLILAHSMGAAIVLRLAQLRPAVADHLAGALLVAPMIGIPTWGTPAWLVRGMARLQRRLGRGRRYVTGQTDWGPADRAYHGNRRTRDAACFEREVALFAARPDLRVGGPTWAWADSAFRLVDSLHGSWPPEALAFPFRVIVGGADAYVSPDEHRRFFTRFPGARVDVIPGALHEVMMETAPVRSRFWALFDAAWRAPPGDA